jgi:hypothetical protein
MRKIELPGQSEPLVLEGGLINPTWYEKLQKLAAAVKGAFWGQSTLITQHRSPMAKCWFGIARPAN